MTEKMERKLLRRFGELIDTEEFKKLHAKKDKRGGRIRSAKLAYNKDELTPSRALLIMAEFGWIKDIEFSDVK